MNWNPSPEILSIGPITLRWYGFLFAMAFIAGLQVMRRVFRTEGKPQDLLDPLLIYLVIGTVLGARLGHCLFYEPDVYLRDPIRILKVWEGGLASHGGLTGYILAVYLFSRRHPSLSFMWLLDRLCMGAAIGGALIRIGNFFNSEIVGRPTSVPWAVTFTRLDAQPRHPAQLYESCAYILTFFFLVFLYRQKTLRSKTGLLFGVYLILTFGFRVLIELLKENQVEFESSLPLNLGQLLSLPLILLGVVLVLRAVKSATRSRRNPSGFVRG